MHRRPRRHLLRSSSDTTKHRHATPPTRITQTLTPNPKRLLSYFFQREYGPSPTPHLWSAGLLGLAAHLRQEIVVSEPAADRVGDLGGVFAESAETSLRNEGHVAGLFVFRFCFVFLGWFSGITQGRVSGCMDEADRV